MKHNIFCCFLLVLLMAFPSLAEGKTRLYRIELSNKQGFAFFVYFNFHDISMI